ncbi:MAG: AbrB/MazE/SpoVT family DNA-binding domain-containing protein [Candidatus Spyradocola sp.]
MKKRGPQGKFMATVKVGPKGQIVIPKEVRDMFGVEPGDTMVLLADVKRGIALQNSSVMGDIMEKIMHIEGEIVEDEEE